MRNGFNRRIKNISSKSNSTFTNSTPALIQNKFAQQHNTNNIAAIQMFDQDQPSSIFWINITKTNMKYNTLTLQIIINPLWKRNKIMKWPFPCQIKTKNKNESTFFPGYHYFIYSCIQNNWQFHFWRALCFLYGVHFVIMGH